MPCLRKHCTLKTVFEQTLHIEADCDWARAGSPSVEDCTLLLSSLSWSESATSSLAAKLNPPTIKPKRLPSSGSQRDLEQGSSFLGIVPYSTHTPSPSRSPAPSVRSTREVEVSRSLFVRSVVHAKLEEQARLLSVSRASSRQDITATTVNRSSSAINRSSSARSLRKTQQPSMRQLEATRRRDEELQAMEVARHASFSFSTCCAVLTLAMSVQGGRVEEPRFGARMESCTSDSDCVALP